MLIIIIIIVDCGWGDQFSVCNNVTLILVCFLVGQYVGSVISFPLTAVLCVYGFDGGWPSVFYVFGKSLKPLL